MICEGMREQNIQTKEKQNTVGASMTDIFKAVHPSDYVVDVIIIVLSSAA